MVGGPVVEMEERKEVRKLVTILFLLPHKLEAQKIRIFSNFHVYIISIRKKKRRKYVRRKYDSGRGATDHHKSKLLSHTKLDRIPRPFIK